MTQALTGVMSINGEAAGGTKLGIPIGDLVGGMFAPSAIVSALYEQQQTGLGRHIDVSLYDGILGLLAYFPQLAWFEQDNPQPVGSGHPNIVPYGVFPTSDGQIVIACLSNAFWHKLCLALELGDMAKNEDLATMEGRKQHRQRVDESISSATGQISTHALAERLDQHDVPNAPVLGILDALKQPHTLAREMVQQVRHSTIGELNVIGRPVKFPESPQTKIKAPPTLGEHTQKALIELLELNPEQIEKLKSIDAIG